MEILTVCVQKTFFQLEPPDIYQQEKVLVMGSPFSLIVANVNMRHFEEMALETMPLKLTLWSRYVDGIFILWSHQKAVQILLDYVKSIKPSIMCTIRK